MKRTLQTTALATLMAAGIGFAATAQDQQLRRQSDDAAGQDVQVQGQPERTGRGDQMQGQQPTQGQPMQGQAMQGQAMQGQQPGDLAEREGFMSIDDWNPQEMYGQQMLSGQVLLDAEAYDATGESLGTIEDVYVDGTDRIVAVVAEVGGFLGIGDTHVIVPWDQVSMTTEGLQIPIDSDNVDQYQQDSEQSRQITARLDQTIAVDDGDEEAAEGVFRLSDLVNDVAMLADGSSYGRVENVYFTDDGEIKAVIISADAGGGTFAYPFRGMRYGWQPGETNYDVGYDRNALGNVEQFDTSQVDVVIQ